MTAADERQALAELAREFSWQWREFERTDYYSKGAARVQVVWQGSARISGGSLYSDDNLASYTRDLTTVTGWLKR